MQQFGPEAAIHGRRWEQLHHGYFANPGVAEPLLQAVCANCARARPDVIADLGGGTGYLLGLLRGAGICSEAKLVDLDASAAQLEVAAAAGLRTVQGAVNAFYRADLVPRGCRTLFLMRSVLHYFGAEGLLPVLQHLRAQAEPGEFWIHQTACFERPADARCLNALYRRMHTMKGYPTIADLRGSLETAGWEVESVAPMPALHLESDELGERYGLTAPDLERIGQAMAEEFGAEFSVFRRLPPGFEAILHYRLFVCRAAG